MSDPVLYADGFEEAFIGVGRQFNQHVAIYDYEKCVKILHERDGMDEDEAVEYMEFNVTGAYVGPATPIFLTTIKTIGWQPDDGPEEDCSGCEDHA